MDVDVPPSLCNHWAFIPLLRRLHPTVHDVSVPEKARSFRGSMETQIIISSRGIPRLLPSGRSHGRSFDDLRIALDQGF